MQTISEDLKATVTTYCTCEAYDEETDTYSLAEWCFGDCGENAAEWASELTEIWLESQDLNEYQRVIIYGTRLGWRSLSGYKLVKPDPLEIVRALYLNGDFDLEFTLTPENKLTATRGSHDELGASFEFDKITVCAWSECEETDNLTQDKYDQPACEFHAEIASVN
jgi:hypothetical protein